MAERSNERACIEVLFAKLDAQPQVQFPKHRQKLVASKSQGVYVVRDSNGQVVHVGRTLRGQEGLFQRLRNHIRGKSSFSVAYLNGNATALRDGFTYQCLDVESDRERALLEHFATAWHRPAHLGLGKKKGAD